MWYKKTTLFAQEKVKTAVTAATGHEPVAVSVAWDYGDCKKTIETLRANLDFEVGFDRIRYS